MRNANECVFINNQFKENFYTKKKKKQLGYVW